MKIMFQSLKAEDKFNEFLRKLVYLITLQVFNALTYMKNGFEMSSTIKNLNLGRKTVFGLQQQSVTDFNNHQ